MARQLPYLHRRSDTLYFRISVPHDLRQIIKARELTRSLKTSDKLSAVPIALLFAAKAKLFFTELRATMAKKKLDDGGITVEYTAEFKWDEKGNPHIKVDAENHETDDVIRLVDSTISAFHAGKSTRSEVDEARLGQRKLGIIHDVVATPHLKEVIDKFLNGYQKNKRPGMYKKHKPVLSMFLEVVGDKPITDLRQADVNEFFEILGRLPPRWAHECKKRSISVRELAEMEFDTSLSPKSFSDTYIACVRPFLRAARKDWSDKGFPISLTTDGIEYLGDREEGEHKQRAFASEELKRIFEGEEMRAFATNPALQHQYWILHIGLFTGARVNEICQINPQVDIVQDAESGLWYFWITSETEADPRIKKSVKTRDARKVPIHQKLIELGFLDYARRMKAAKHKLLFPAWQPINKRASGEAEKWVRKFFREIGVRDDSQKAKISGMHAFRHTLLTYGAMQRPKLNLTKITGHSEGDLPVEARGAAKGYFTKSMLNPISDLSELLNQLDFGLNFHSAAGVA